MKKKQPLTALEIIEKAQYPIIIAPFFGYDTPIKLRELRQTEISDCGDFSLIETFQDTVNQEKLKNNPKMEQVYDYAEILHNIARKSLVNPTYDEILKVIGGDKIIERNRKELKELKELLSRAPRGVKRKELEDEIRCYEADINLLLPNDFLNFIFCYAMGIEKSDIKLISEKVLIRAAVLAEQGNDNPFDHIDGKWPEIQYGFYRDDINIRAKVLLRDERSKQKQGANVGG